MTSTSPLNFLRYGVWASITGGWLYDPRQSLFCNTVHMYLWLILFASPMMISMFFTVNVSLMVVYSIMVGIVFMVAKTVIWTLNYIFDKYEPSDDLPMSSVVVVDGCKLKCGTQKDNMPKGVTCSEQCDDSDFELREIPKGFSSENISEEHIHCVSSEASSSKSVIGAGIHADPSGSACNDIAVEADVHGNPEDISPTDKLRKPRPYVNDVKSSWSIPPLSETFPMDGKSLTFLRRRADLPDSYDRTVCQRGRSSCSTHSGLRRSCSLLEIVRRSNRTCALSLEKSYPCFKRIWASSFPGATSSVEVLWKKTYISVSMPTCSRKQKTQDSQQCLSFPRKFLDLSNPLTFRERQWSFTRAPMQWREHFADTTESASTSSRKERVPLQDAVTRYTSSCEARLASSDASNVCGEFCQSSVTESHDEHPEDLPTCSKAERPSSDPVKEITRHSSSTMEFPQRSKGSECGSSPSCADSRTFGDDGNRLFDGLRESLRLLKTYSGRGLPMSQEELPGEELALRFRTFSCSSSPTSSVAASDGTRTLKECVTQNGSRTDSPCSTVQPLKAFCQENQYPCDTAAMSKEFMVEEIKRLLEEIIESHPEALQAIESVRQAKLRAAGLVELKKYPMDLLDSLIQDRLTVHHEKEANGSQRNAVSATSHDTREPLSKRPAAESTDPGDSEERNRALLLSMMQAGKHMAASHDDTSEGAMHCFQDQEGNWWSYTFSSNGTGTAQSLGTDHELKRRLKRFYDAQPGGPSSSKRSTMYRQESAENGSTSSEESLLAGIPSSVFHPVTSEVIGNPARTHNMPTSRGRSLGMRLRTLDAVLPPNRESRLLYPPRIRPSQHRFVAAPSSVNPRARDRTVAERALGADNRNSYPGAFAMPGRSVRTGLNQMRVLGNMALLFRRPNVNGTEIPAKKVCYTVPLPVTIFGRDHLKIHFDRLRLSSLFDRNSSLISLSADVALAVMVSVIAFLLLMKQYYHDFGTLFLCFSAAGAQFCLLKSVQPDAASPVHGYNSVVPYSRPVYFCIFGTMVMLIDPLRSSLASMRDEFPGWHSRLEGALAGLSICQEGLIRLVLFLPLLFTIGVLPQLNTFCCYLLEQVDMHVFGGTACFNLASAVYCCARSIVCVAVLFLLGYLSISGTSSSQSVPFSAYCGFMVFFSYLLSRSTSNPKAFFGCLRCIFQARMSHLEKEEVRPLCNYKESVNSRVLELRLRNNIFLASAIGLLSFALHCSTVFTMFPTILGCGFSVAAVILGAVAHYFLPQLRKHTPCTFLSRPVLRTKEYGLFDVNDIAKVMWFERLFAWLHCVECHMFYPTVILSFVTRYGFYAVTTGSHAGFHALVLSVAGLKLLRSAFNNSGSLFLSLGFSLLVTHADGSLPASHLILTFFLFSVLLPKLRELILKLRFIFAYVAPWQISWGSAFHAFAQPCAISHSALTLVITAVSSILSAPLNPFMGSSVFLMSYVRPVKFWEKDYNTMHMDNSNTRLATQIDRGPTTDDSNLNAIFYEHLTRSLEEHLAGDLMLGRFASELEPGDCFILASFYLNCLVHVIEIGNGFVTFQLRGLEFRGTYCQQREVEAITEDVNEVDGCCCAGDGCRLPGFVTLNAAWNMRWLAWEIKTARYILDGYSVTDNSAISLFQLIELRKLLITLYVKCIIYFAIKSNRITEWIQLESVVDMLELVQCNPDYVDVDPTFCYQNDEDYDVRRNGISYESFCTVYLSWITCCADRSSKSLVEDTKYGREVRKMVVTLCYVLSLFGRRLLGAAAQSHTTNAESFLYGLHALFKGDFRITCSRDEWVFSDIDILSGVIAPAVRMALKLHQDQFTYAEDFDDNVCLYNLITGEGSTVFISHENDPAWRNAVLSNTAKLLALRHVSEDGLDDFKIIMLNKRFVSFRVIKLNRECVRAFWAGQQQELVFLRNRNPERGSIQNARQVLRNIINSSADQPIGYPIYVSPLTTSYSETHPQLSSVLGPADLFKAVGDKVVLLWRYLQLNCGMSGSSAIGAIDQGLCQRSYTLPVVAIELQPVKGRTPTARSTLRRSNLSLPVIEEGRSTGSALLQRSSTHPVDRSVSTQMLVRSSDGTVGSGQQRILSAAMQNGNSRIHLLCSGQRFTKSNPVTAR